MGAGAGFGRAREGGGMLGWEPWETAAGIGEVRMGVVVRGSTWIFPKKQGNLLKI